MDQMDMDLGGSEQVENENSVAVGGSGETTPNEGQTTGSEGQGGAEGATPGEEGAVAPAYQPNFKFKVLNKEHEIDEFVRGAIKDADSEKKIRELYEKAYGLDAVKPRFQENRQRLQEVTQSHQQVMGDIQELRGHYSRGDFDSFFEKLQIPQEKVFQWVLDKVNYNELPPEQRQVLDERQLAKRQAYRAESQLEGLQRQYQEQISSAKDYALGLALDRAEVKTFAEQYDERAGQPGAFKEAVRDRGEWVWTKRGVDLTPEQAIKEVMTLAGYAPGAQGQGQPQAAKPNPQQTVVVQQPKAGVIPNVTGNSTSPLKTRPKNLDDIRKIAAQFN